LKPTVEAGVGIIYSPGLEPVIRAGRDIIDVIEIEPQLFWQQTEGDPDSFRIDPAFLDRMHGFPQHKLIHGVGFPIGGSLSHAEAQLPTFIETIEAMNALWASEHLSFNRAASKEGEFNAGFLLPPQQSEAAIRRAVENIRAIQSRLPVPFAFETGVNYLQPQAGDMEDGTFFAAIATDADCGILLDLHNLWCNERNGRQPIEEALAQIPLDRVWEVHLAGGEEMDGYWLDAHSGLVPQKLMELAADIIPRLPNLGAIIFEIMEDYVTEKNIQTRELVEQMERIKEIWETRKTRITGLEETPHVRAVQTTHIQAAPAIWERDLARLATGQSGAEKAVGALAADPGIPIYKNLISAVRAGMSVTALRLSYRLIVLHRGEEAFKALIEDFWSKTPPEPFASEEVLHFAQYLKSQDIDIPHLSEVIEFELASQEVLRSGKPETIRFTCEPMSLLDALGQGQLQVEIDKGNFELTIEP